MTTFIQLTIGGTAIGLLYAIAGMGLSLTFEVTRVVNMAQGTLIAGGGYLGFWLYATEGLPYPLVVMVGLIGGGAVGALLYLTVLRFLKRGEMMQAILATIAISAIITGVIFWLAGTEPFSVTTIYPGTVEIGSVSIAYQDLVIAGAALVLASGVSGFLKYTSLGRALRAVAVDPDSAALLGISPIVTATIAWGIGVGLAVVSGVLIAPQFVVSIESAGTLLVIAFAVAIIGGFGSVGGALIGGVLLGVATTLFSYYVSSAYETTAIMVLMILATLLLPRGIAGTKDIREV